jgi:hypothetical protein
LIEFKVRDFGIIFLPIKLLVAHDLFAQSEDFLSDIFGHNNEIHTKDLRHKGEGGFSSKLKTLLNRAGYDIKTLGKCRHDWAMA